MYILPQSGQRWLGADLPDWGNVSDTPSLSKHPFLAGLRKLFRSVQLFTPVKQKHYLERKEHTKILHKTGNIENGNGGRIRKIVTMKIICS